MGKLTRQRSRLAAWAAENDKLSLSLTYTFIVAMIITAMVMIWYRWILAAVIYLAALLVAWTCLVILPRLRRRR